MIITAIAIIVLGLILRFRYINLPLDWDHGLLLYQSYWYDKLGKFIASWSDNESESRNTPTKMPTSIEETSMIRYQTLGFSFINIINYLICRDRVWAYRLADIFYSLITTTAVFLWGSLIFDPASAALGASLFFLFFSMPFYWGAMDNPEKFQILFTICALICVTLALQTSHLIYCIPAGIFFFISMTFKQNVGFVILFTLIFMVIHIGLIAVCVTLATLFVCYSVLFSYYMLKGYPFDIISGRVFVSFKAFFYLYNIKRDENGKIVKSKEPNLISKIKPNLIKILKESSLLWALSLLWIIYTAATSPGSYTLHMLVLVFIGSLLAFLAANKFFPYYYIPFLPILALTSGNLYYRILTSKGILSIEGMAILIITAALSILGAVTTFRFFFKSTPFEQGAYMYSNTLYNFGKSEEIGNYIRMNTKPEDYICVYNLSPEIYFFSQRKSPTNTLYVDVLTAAVLTREENVRLEQIYKEKIRAASPAYVVINKGTNMPIEYFIQVTGKKYFLEKEYHAGYDVFHNPIIQQLFKQRKVEEARHHIDAGEELFSQDRIAEAMTAFEEALTFDPLSSDALNNLGVCHYRQGNIIKVVENFAKALQVNPGNRDVVLNLLDLDITAEYKVKILDIYLAANPKDAEIQRISRELQSSKKKL